MQRTSLAWFTLQLKALGVDDVLHFDFMSPPLPQTMMRALELLYSLGALDEACKLTHSIGMHMAEFPIEPTIAGMLLNAGEAGCTEEMLTIAAMLSVAAPFHRNSSAAQRAFAVSQGDHLTLLNVYNSFIRHRRDTAWINEHRVNRRALVHATEIRKQVFGCRDTWMRSIYLSLSFFTVSDDTDSKDCSCKHTCSGLG